MNDNFAGLGDGTSKGVTKSQVLTVDGTRSTSLGSVSMADASSSAPAKDRKSFERSLSQLQSLPYPDRFFVAARYVGLYFSTQDDSRQHTPPELSDETKLLLYSLYQQATKGPCKDPRPSRWNMVEQAKWASWERLKDLAPPEAMRLFVRTLEEQDLEWYHKAQPQLLGPAESSQGSADLAGTDAVPERNRELSDQGVPGSDLLSSSATELQSQEAGALQEGPSSAVNGAGARTGGQGLDQVDQGFYSESSTLTNGISAANGSPRKIRHKHGVGAGIRSVAVVNEWISVSCSGYRPPGRYQHAAAAVDDKLFVVGGNHNGRFLNDVQVLDLTNLKWTKVDNKRSTASLSSLADAQDWLPPCAGHSLIRDGNKLLSVAGHTRTASETVVVHSFDLYTQSWSLLPVLGSAPVARGGQTVTKVESTLIMFGGEDSRRRLLNDVCILDLETQVWEIVDAAGTPPSPRTGHTAALYGDRYLLVFGGSAHSRCYNDLHILDLQNMEWSQAQPQGLVPTARSGHAGLVVGNNWYIVGGGDNKSGLPETMVLDMSTLIWSDVVTVESSSPIAAEGLSVVAIPDGDAVFLLAYGGYNGWFASDVHVLKAIQPTKPKPRLVKSSSAAAAAASAASAVAAKNQNKGLSPTNSLGGPFTEASPQQVHEGAKSTQGKARTEVDVHSQEELLAVKAEVAQLKKELAETQHQASEYKDQLVSVRSQLEAEASRCFHLEVELSQFRQTLQAMEELKVELDILRRQKNLDDAAAAAAVVPEEQEESQKQSSGGLWGWLAGESRS